MSSTAEFVYLEIQDVRESMVRFSEPWDQDIQEPMLAGALAESARTFRSSLDSRRRACDYASHLGCTLAELKIMTSRTLTDVLARALIANSVLPDASLRRIATVIHTSASEWLAPLDPTYAWAYVALDRHTNRLAP